MKEELNILIQAKYPLIYLVTPEEERAEAAIAHIGESCEYETVYVWTMTHGLVRYDSDRKPQPRTLSAEAAIREVENHAGSGIFIFKDLHPFLDDPSTVRWLRDAIASFKSGANKNIILMSPYQKVPLELEKDVVVLDFPLPTLDELDLVLSKHLSPLQPTSAKTREKLLKAALGLTKDEAEKVYRKAQVKAQKLTAAEVDIVLSEKKQLIRRNGILEFIEEDETIDSRMPLKN